LSTPVKRIVGALRVATDGWRIEVTVSWRRWRGRCGRWSRTYIMTTKEIS